MNVIVFLNSLDADENFFHDSLAGNNCTPVCKSFLFKQVKEFSKNSNILNINLWNFNRNFDKFKIMFRNQQDYPCVLVGQRRGLPAIMFVNLMDIKPITYIEQTLDGMSVCVGWKQFELWNFRRFIFLWYHDWNDMFQHVIIFYISYSSSSRWFNWKIFSQNEKYKWNSKHK